MADKEQIITIIGGGAAAFYAAKSAREHSKAAHIIMLSREKYLPYFRTMLTKTALDDFDAKSLEIESEQWYNDNDIIPLLGKTVASIDTSAKTVSLDNGSTFAYDKLIYALGAESFIPPITGLYKDEKLLDGVTVLRTVDDAQRINTAIKGGAKNAVVIGGGVLGLEAAWELKQAGLDVTVLETAPRLMPRQLDEASSARLLKSAKDSGVNIETGVKISAVFGDTAAEIKRLGIKLLNELLDSKIVSDDDKSNSVRGVVLEDGRYFPCDLLVLSTGVRTNIAVAQAAGIECGRGITVDETMCTSAPDVFACGDCAEYNGINYALWSQASAQGAVAGANAVGGYESYTPEGGPVSFMGFNTSLFAVGDNGSSPDKAYRTVESSDPAAGSYERYYFTDNKLTGAILFGSGTDVWDVQDAVKKSLTMKETLGLIQ